MLKPPTVNRSFMQLAGNTTRTGFRRGELILLLAGSLGFAIIVILAVADSGGIDRKSVV